MRQRSYGGQPAGGPVGFIVTRRSSGGTGVDGEVMTDPVPETVHTRYGRNRPDNIDDDCVPVRGGKRLTEEDKDEPGHGAAVGMDGTEYGYAYARDHAAGIRIPIGNGRMGKLLGGMDGQGPGVGTEDPLREI